MAPAAVDLSQSSELVFLAKRAGFEQHTPCFNKAKGTKDQIYVIMKIASEVTIAERNLGRGS